MTGGPSELEQAERHRTLFLLDARISAARAELSRLNGCVADGERRQLSRHEALLLGANERLVLSALDARADAQAVRDDLGALAELSQRDPLTRIPGRGLALDRLETAIASARRNVRKLGVLFLDLDGFKHINDSRGHAAGDRALQAVARRLTGVVRESDTVARFGGDEFLVVLADIDGGREAALVATKMLWAMADAEADPPEAGLSASIGIALYPEDAQSGAELVACADRAMYRAKAEGGGRGAFYDARTVEPPGPASPAEVAAPPTDGRSMTAQAQRARPAGLRQADDPRVPPGRPAPTLYATAGDSHQREAMFLARLAHELRSPLDPIRMATELLQHAQANGGLLGQVQGLLRRQADHLARLADDLLDGARASAGKFRLECRPIALRETLAPVIDAARPAIAQRQQTLTTCLQADAIVVHADPQRLAQAFGKLLDNASTYTPRGGRIGVALHRAGPVATLRISDNGFGISAQALPRIFGLFVHEPHAHAHEGQGLGLGLAIVRELVEAHGGAIAASSPGRGLGSQFVVTLPVLAGGPDGRSDASAA